MSRTQVFVLTLLAMMAFAGNSLLCRFALKHTVIDAASFTSIRLISGAVALWLIVQMRAADTKPATGSVNSDAKMRRGSAAYHSLDFLRCFIGYADLILLKYSG